MTQTPTSGQAHAPELAVEDRTGTLYLGASRALLYSHVSVEMLRKQLFHQVGEDLARVILAQAAHHGGWNDAQLLLQELPFDSVEAMLRAQYVQLTRSGFGVFQIQDVAVSNTAKEMYLRVTCQGSPEAESHGRLFGISTQPACCHLVGYSSGWASAILGMQILTIETRCAAKGDPCCEFETMPYDDFFGGEAAFWKRTFESTGVSLAQELKQQLHTIQGQLAIIERQRVALLELAAPILQLADGIIALPIIGTIDGDRAALMTERLLDAVVTRRAWGVIIDVTGVDSLEVRTAQNLSRMAQTSRLLGAKVVLTGIAPSVAQLLVEQDVRLADVQTHRTLQDGIRFLQDSGRR